MNLPNLSFHRTYETQADPFISRWSLHLTTQRHKQKKLINRKKPNKNWCTCSKQKEIETKHFTAKPNRIKGQKNYQNILTSNKQITTYQSTIWDMHHWITWNRSFTCTNRGEASTESSVAVEESHRQRAIYRRRREPPRERIEPTNQTNLQSEQE